MESDYDCDASRLVDVVRCSIVVDDESQLVAVSDALLRGSIHWLFFTAVRLKNRYVDPLFNGHRDALFNIAVPIGEDGNVRHVCEVQVQLAPCGTRRSPHAVRALSGPLSRRRAGAHGQAEPPADAGEPKA